MPYVLHQGCTIFAQISCYYKSSIEGPTNIKECRGQFSRTDYLVPETYARLSYMVWSTVGSGCHIIQVPWLRRSVPGTVHGDI